MQSGKLFTGTGTHGNSNTGFYVDNAGNFSLKDKLVWNGSSLTLKGALRQTAAGDAITDYVDRGNWASGNNYAVNDLVQYSGATWKCVGSHTSTNNTSTSTGRPDTSSSTVWTVYAAAGTDGTDGTDGNDGATGATGPQGVTGAAGSDGAAGVSARTVNLTAGEITFTYNSGGTSPSPTNTTITATALNTTGTVYYDFFLNDSSVQNTTSNTYTYTPQTNQSNMPDKIEVQIREGSNSSAVLARDQITTVGVKPGVDGEDAITIAMTNEAHTLPENAAGVINYSGSGTDFQVYIGTQRINYGGGNSGFTITANPSNISTGTATTVSSHTRRFANHSGMTATNATITYSITVVNASGVSNTFTKIQSY